MKSTKSKQRCFIIGDIHACFFSLQSLLAQVNFDKKKDKLYACGDLIGRGKWPEETLDFLMSCPHFFTVLGNHDLNFLAATFNQRQLHKKDHLDHIKSNKTYQKWLLKWPLIHETDDFVLVHAGLSPSYSLQALLYLQENLWFKVPHSPEFWFGQMFVNTSYLHKKSAASNYFQYLVNTCTRMRFCDESSLSLDFTCKKSIDKAPEYLKPWYELRAQNYPNDKLVFFGHWAGLDGRFEYPHFGLDTGCVWGKKLSLYALNEHKVYQVNTHAKDLLLRSHLT